MDIQLLKNGERQGSGEVGHGGGGVGQNGGTFLWEGGGVGNFWWYTGEGVRTYPPVVMKNVSQASHSSYNFRLFSFQLKDIHKNNYSSISDYFLSNLTTKRLSNKKKKNLGVFHVHKREWVSDRERERNIFIGLSVEQDALAYKITYSRWFCSQVTLMLAFVVSDHLLNHCGFCCPPRFLLPCPPPPHAHTLKHFILLTELYSAFVIRFWGWA